MRRPSQTTRVLAASTSLAAALLIAGALPANADVDADRANGPSATQATDGQTRAAQARDRSTQRPAREAADQAGDRPASRAPVEKAQHARAQHEQAPSQKDADRGTDRPAADGSPPGNNGTVKVAPYGAVDTIPDNTAHPGCQFQIEWYGFDATDRGEDVLSTVEFVAQAPTSDVTVATDGPSAVSLDGDEARGAGTETGQDAVQTYTLSFTGEPHPLQGYHVKLTIHTPYSQGDDTKTKVFWVEGCEQPTAEETTPATGSSGTPLAPARPEAVTGTPAVAGTGVLLPEPRVLGVQAFAAGASGAASAAVVPAIVPTAVAAGLDGAHRDAQGATHLALLLGAAGGLALTGAAARRRLTAVRR